MQFHDDAVAGTIPVASGEIPIDAAANLLALSAHGDRLGNQQAGVCVNDDMHVVVEDALLRLDLTRQQQRAQQRP